MYSVLSGHKTSGHQQHQAIMSLEQANSYHTAAENTRLTHNRHLELTRTFANATFYNYAEKEVSGDEIDEWCFPDPETTQECSEWYKLSISSHTTPSATWLL